MRYRSNCGCLVSSPEPTMAEYASTVAYCEVWNKWKEDWERTNRAHRCPKSIDFVDHTDNLWGAAIECLRDATERCSDPAYNALRLAAIGMLKELRSQMEKLPH